MFSDLGFQQGFGSFESNSFQFESVSFLRNYLCKQYFSLGPRAEMFVLRIIKIFYQAMPVNNFSPKSEKLCHISEIIVVKA